MIRTISHSTIETEQIGKRLAALLKGNEVIALFGDLGAGKTAFTRGLCEALGIDEVSSPTFAIVNEYSGKFSVYHFDMYRITSLDDLYSTGFYDYLGNGVMVIEWSENIESELDDSAIRIHIGKTDNENERIFTIEGMDAYADTFT
ncbi:MAG: tRNA (adenosine(37)-N6)-threonylcarbamoyltransferase complex ATPase subunit type 1 TsaE [Ruminococcus sp.]|nr:tRNA (adenosine(37)-N6)-threonylcarbamoyltransferase complex ATPase subunit type 1 TsaE [Ruminococcus sp.]